MRHQRLKRFTPIYAVLAAAILAGLIQPASAEQARRSKRKSQPTTVTRTAPDITATIPQSKPPAARTDADDAPLKPFFLPAAPRSRMRACGLKWQGVKMSGRAGDETWRDFATKCLAEREDAEKKSQP